jgi:hypothetical protein
MAVYFGSFVTRYFFGRRRTLGGLLYDRRGSGDLAEVSPVIAVVTYEVRDLAEGLVRDGMLERHDEDSVLEMNEVGMFFVFVVYVCCCFPVMRSRCEAGNSVFW